MTNIKYFLLSLAFMLSIISCKQSRDTEQNKFSETSSLQDKKYLSEHLLSINKQLSEIKHTSVGRQESYLSVIRMKQPSDSIFPNNNIWMDSINTHIEQLLCNSAKIDSILYVIERSNEKSKLLYNRSINIEAGETKSFVISGKLGDIISINKMTTHADITQAYSISEDGELLPGNGILYDNKRFCLRHPIEAFNISSRDTGCCVIAITINKKTDTLYTRIVPRVIYYKIDTISPCVTTQNPKEYEITFNILFSKSILNDVTFNITTELIVNSTRETIEEKITAPEGTSQYRKTIIYRNTGRIPYYFAVKSINIKNINDPSGTLYIIDE